MSAPNQQTAFVSFLSSLPPEGEMMLLGIQKQDTDGKMTYVPTETLPPNKALYANTGSFIKARAENGYLTAKSANIEHCLFLMLDDVGTKAKTPPVEPTWKVETSPGNFQWGYAYSERPTKAAQSAAVKAFAAAGYSDPGANNPVRWSRIPGSLNARKEFVAVLHEFYPDRRFVLSELCAAMGVTPGEQQDNAPFEGVPVKDDGTDDVLAWLSANGHVLERVPNQEGWIDVRCPDGHEHSDGREGAGYRPATRAFKCLHSHGNAWTSRRFLEWVADQGGPKHSYGIRPELLPFGNVPDQQQPTPSEAYAVATFAKHGLDMANYAAAVALLPHPDGAFALKTGDKRIIEYRNGAGRIRASGVLAPVLFGSMTEKIVYVSDDWFSAAAIHEATGNSVVCVEGWSFGEVQGEDGENSRALHTDLLSVVRPGLQMRVIASVQKDTMPRMATFRMLMLEEGVDVRAFALPDNAASFGEWALSKWGSRDHWPTGDNLTKVMFGKQGELLPIPDDELANAARTYTMSNAERFGRFHLDLTDRGAGSYILSKLGRGGFFFLRDRREWVQWKGGAWRSIGGEPISLIDVAAHGYLQRSDVLNRQAEYLDEQASAEKEPERRKELTADAKRKRTDAAAFYARHLQLSSTHGRGAVLKDLQGREEVATYSGNFDADGWLLGVRNGVIDLRTGALRESRKEDMMFRRCPTRYIPGAKHPKIDKLLREMTAVGYVKDGPEWMGLVDGYHLDANRQRWLQRRMGAAVIGGNKLTSLEIRHGIGSNGKSVEANMLEATFGKAGTGVGENGYAVTVPAGAIMSAYHSKDPDAATPYLATTVGARFLLMNESRDTDKLNEQLIKGVTGGSAVPYRGLYKGAASFLPQFTPFLYTNHLPQVVEGGDAIWDRLAPMEYKMRWARPNANEEDKRRLPPEDIWFRDVAPVCDEAREAFLAWLVEGCVAWQNEGLGDIPADIILSVHGYRENSDVFRAWMEDEQFTLDAGGFVPSDDLYFSYSNWTKRNGNQPPAKTVFVKRLLEQCGGLRSGRKELRRGIFGILRPCPPGFFPT